MPDSYGRPLWMSPRLRWDSSHAAPNGRNVNDPAAKANPMTYQIPVKAILVQRARAPAWTPEALDREFAGQRGIRDQPSGRRPSPLAILSRAPVRTWRASGQASQLRAGWQPAPERQDRKGTGG